MFRHIINLLGRTIFHLFTLGLCIIDIGIMNIIRAISNARRHAEISRELREKLDKIPESRLNGIQSLPVELWSEIIGLVLDPYLLCKRRQCHSILRILELRLVCRMFRFSRVLSGKS